MDAIAILKADHKAVEALFKKYEGLGDRAVATKRKVVDQMIKELSVHAAIEEQVFYPGVRSANAEIKDVVLEGLEEHHIVKWTLSELEKMDPEDERFDAKVTVLMESVRHHVEEEEGEMFPEVRKSIKASELKEMGAALLEAKKLASTHPHPAAADERPRNRSSRPMEPVEESLADRATAAGRRAAVRAHGS